ncbi:hypothetical protein DY000_02055779 [Brassica cretica]|uniref:Uncharacterized protein n=1 Tax=Brassica cretica TaxID=69181 RepID=A0ABQ7ACC2_BRACR|nr:hypothetical protein DY000_02055779 [Brassica cretica]
MVSCCFRLKLQQYKSKENRSELSVPLEKSTSVLALVLCVREHQRVPFTSLSCIISLIIINFMRHRSQHSLLPLPPPLFFFLVSPQLHYPPPKPNYPLPIPPSHPSIAVLFSASSSLS